MNESRPGPWRIYLVDDRPENIGFIQDALENGGHEIQTFLDGRTALQKIEEQPPDFVLLDLQMPGLSGMEVLRKIRETDRLSRVIVIVLSAHPREEVEGECREAGANEVLGKPVRIRLLREVLSELKSRQ
jgi:CheY-like chemotaxis protein